MNSFCFVFIVSCISASSVKDVSGLIHHKGQLKNDDFSCTHYHHKNNDSLNNNEETEEPDEPIDGPSRGSGLDNDKYLELDELDNGGYELPDDADYTGDIGRKLLRYVKPGDIMYDSVGLGSSGSGSGHVALIEGIAYSQRYQKNYIVTIEANPNHGVKRGYIDKTRFEDHKSILRVKNATHDIIDDAIYFCQEQLGKKYELDILRKHTSINSNEWYCSELVWAAYKYNENGIDLANGAWFAVTPHDINNDSDTCKIMKHNCSTTFTTNSVNHTFHCDGDEFTEPHNHDGDYFSIEQCTVCNHIFWPNC